MAPIWTFALGRANSVRESTRSGYGPPSLAHLRGRRHRDADLRVAPVHDPSVTGKKPTTASSPAARETAAARAADRAADSPVGTPATLVAPQTPARPSRARGPDRRARGAPWRTPLARRSLAGFRPRAPRGAPRPASAGRSGPARSPTSPSCTS